MEKLPLVSIGLPVYNGEKYLRQTLHSLLAQDYENFELIISDNGSADHTLEICQEYAEKDHRVRYYRNETNLGASYNFQRVFQLASGEFFMWAGSHDLWTPDCISRLIYVLQTEPNVALAYTETHWIDEDGNDRDISPYHLDTRGLSRIDRIKKVVKTLYALNLFYGLYRVSLLKNCRTQLRGLGPDHVLLMEVSLFGEIAEVPGKGFIRRVSYLPRGNVRRWRKTRLLRMDPNYRYKKVRAHWEMGWNHVLGIWHAPLSLGEKLYLTFAVTKIFYSRFRNDLHYEIFHPTFSSSGKDVEVPNW
ncbi:MAG TPA: glycosyltransferase family A protein [Anaerolineales bacterium]|nr:glycosyltransferase family A protein [Anaerolineales bacterium]